MEEYIKRSDAANKCAVEYIRLLKLRDYIGSDAVYKLLTEFCHIPSADIAEVRHGRWLISSDGYYPYCSECKCEPTGEMSKFCPSCGAQMDEDIIRGKK